MSVLVECPSCTAFQWADDPECYRCYYCESLIVDNEVVEELSPDYQEDSQDEKSASPLAPGSVMVVLPNYDLTDDVEPIDPGDILYH
jgi:hypothetical protein